MKWVIEAKSFNPDDKAQVSLLQLLCSLEFALSSARWYVGEVENLPQLPRHEQILALAINIASVGEALQKFKNLLTRVLFRSKKLGMIEPRKVGTCLIPKRSLI